jgi:hypothetical protein
MVDPKKLRQRTCYFHLNYLDRGLTVPDLRTLFFLESEGETDEKEPRWIFQDAAHFASGSSNEGLLSLTSLEALFDWEGIVQELARNFEAQKQRVPFD